MKLKRGTPFLHENKTVYVERDLENGQVLICDAKTRSITDNFTTVVIDTLQPVRKSLKTNQIKSTKNYTAERINEKRAMTAFYESLWDKIPINCEECGQPLQVWNAYARRSVSCHILPKQSFESVAMCEDNILYMNAAFLLGPCAHHDVWDSSLDRRKRMKVYPKAIEQFHKFKHLLTKKEYEDALDYLGLTD